MSDQDHRAPRDLQDLLRLAVENQVARDNTGASGGNDTDTPSLASDSERQQWLNEALIQVQQNDPIREMQKGIKTLKESLEQYQQRTEQLDEKLEEDIVYTLETLVDYVGSIDLANDFTKLSGQDLILPLLAVPSNEIKMKSCELLAEVVQNNHQAQKYALEAQLLRRLIELLDRDPSESVRIKALYAISCLIRDNREAARTFDSECDGLSVLLRAMQQESETHKLRIKASFLITALCIEDQLIKDTLFKMGFVEQLVALLHQEHNPSHEYLLSALNALITDHDGSKEECRRTELGLEQLLNSKLTLLCGNPAYSEERYFANEVLKTVFNSGETTAAVNCADGNVQQDR